MSFRLLASTNASVAGAATDVPISQGPALGGGVARIDAGSSGVISLVNLPMPAVTDTTPMQRAIDLLVAGGGSTTANVTVGDGVNGDLDVDLYRVMGVAGETLLINTAEATFDHRIRLFSANGGGTRGG